MSLLARIAVLLALAIVLLWYDSSSAFHFSLNRSTATKAMLYAQHPFVSAPVQNMRQTHPPIVCDGVTDNQPAIQAAIDALEAELPPGGSVLLPACDKIAIRSTIRISKPNIHLIGTGSGMLSINHTQSSWFDNADGPAMTVLGWFGAAAPMVDFEPAPSGIAVLGGGIRNMVLAGRGIATNNLVLRTMRGGEFDQVIAENCTDTCIELSVTTNVLKAREFCDTQYNHFGSLQVFISPALSEFDKADGLRLDGLLSTSRPLPYGCNPANIEANTSFNIFDHLTINHTNGVGIIFAEAASNVFERVEVGRNKGGTGDNIQFLCADASHYPARLNLLQSVLASGSGAVVAKGCAGSGVRSSFDNIIEYADTAVWGVNPTIENGATLYWSNTNGDSNWLTRARPDYVANSWYVPMDAYTTVQVGMAPGSDKIVCTVGTVPRIVNIDMLAVRVTTPSARGNVQAAMYADVNGRPAALIAHTGSINVAGTGSRTGVLRTSVRIGPGTSQGRQIWFCINLDNNKAAFAAPARTSSSQAALIGAASVDGVLDAPVTALSCVGANCHGGSSTFGSWPASLAGSRWTGVSSAAAAAIAFHVKEPPPILRPHAPAHRTRP